MFEKQIIQAMILGGVFIAGGVTTAVAERSKFLFLKGPVYSLKADLKTANKTIGDRDAAIVVLRANVKTKKNAPMLARSIAKTMPTVSALISTDSYGAKTTRSLRPSEPVPCPARR